MLKALTTSLKYLFEKIVSANGLTKPGHCLPPHFSLKSHNKHLGNITFPRSDAVTETTFSTELSRSVPVGMLRL